MGPAHSYRVTVEWTGNRGDGTATYRSYGREHDITADGPSPIAGSADRTFRGDPARWNPEQLLLAAASQCHMLSYLHQAASNGVVVVAYRDEPVAVMTEDGAGGGRFTEIVLHPEVTISAGSDPELALVLHEPAGRACFIANSLNLPVQHRVRTVVAA
ncbi:OsmC family protein [Jatrophihabitans sp.]|uniref:OsmC family protein n=1 Tax=Jatrophihabitans sp. TaxID=1932789 RepID=UPI0030C677A9|nr:peroxiredoxin [Jatrophihabitans sp.]